MIRAVVFDLGEVLASPPSLLETIAERIGVTPEAAGARYWVGRAEYDAGASDEDYWGAFLDGVGVAAAPGLIEAVAALDAGLWAELRPAAAQLLRDCRAAGVSVAVLSNAPHSMEVAAQAAPWRADIDHLFVSATLGVVKPDPRIYRHAAAELGLDGPEIAFVDDRQENVDGALEAGWRAHLWTGDDDTRAWLEALGVL